MGHIETAVGMFNAGEILREHFQGHPVGTEAERANKRSVVIPMTVVYILGIEVGIKALIEKQGQQPPHIHELDTLYGKLDSSIETRIEHKLKSSGASVPSASRLLSYHRKSFEQWRYMGDFGDTNVVDPYAIAATLRSIVEVHTEIYGAKTKEAPDRREEGVSPSVQTAAAEYLSKTGQENSAES